MKSTKLLLLITLLITLCGCELFGKSIPKVVANWNKGELQPIPAIIVAPQSDGRWATEDPSYTRNVNSIKAIIESAKEIYNIDTSKIVITGYSLGGRGVTSVAYEMQKRFSKDYFSKLLVMSSGSGAIYPSKDSKEGKAYFKSKDIKGFAEPGTNTKDFFDWIGKPEKYRELKNATHGTIAEKVFTLDENKNKISDMVEWMFLD